MNSSQIYDLCGVILDMDGVLWKESEPLADLPAIFDWIAERDWKVMGMTNNSTRTPDHYLSQLRSFGVRLKPWQVINSSETTADYLLEKHPGGGPIFMVGEKGLFVVLKGCGFEPFVAELKHGKPLAVVAGMDRELTYSKIETAARYIRKGVPFIGTNPDRTYPTPHGLSPGAGVVLAAIEAAAGQKPTIMGKPHQRMYLAALDRMACEPENVLVVGDRLETDILGAQNVGCKSALVLSGVSTELDLKGWSPAPDFVASDITQLFGSLDRNE